MFFKNFAEPHAGKDQFSLKVTIKDGAEVEQMRLADLRQENAQWSGVVNNIPRMVSNVQVGQRFTIARKDISNWMYMENGKIFGG
ncbi:MAG: DUF2314 domain-containing protein [Alphaproteobacteria bacterium]|nr:DUF2314 domain-containing protein [Alphaproteobacteria bacterium]